MEESHAAGARADPSAGTGFHVVGIGASAGGLGALRTLFSSMPPSPGIACVVVVHLSPEHESHLVSLLQPYTSMPVAQVTDTVAMKPNRIYVIPPNANLNSIDTHLRLTQLEERRIERAPIDHFMRTLATTHDGTAIGVILTGSGSDGSLGLRQIKERGGLTVVQDPAEAEYDSMPRNAIATGMIDVVSSLRDIPAEILGFCQTQPQLPVLGDDTDADDDIHLGEAEAVTFEKIVWELERRTGHELHVYRRANVLKRLGHRMRVRHVETLNGYLDVLREHHGEAQALANDLLLTVTEFFRDSEFYERLERRVIPSLLDRKQNHGDRLRAWSIGCSTGEEAYSLAMVMMEQAAERAVRPHLQVFASDLSDEMLKRAREGVYPLEVAVTVPPERLDRFFTKHPGYYRVHREVRDVVVFASHNVFRDPPYSHLDLVVCRNLLRELQPEVRRGVIRLFHYALEPHGLMIVGSRAIEVDPTLFVCEDAAAGIYRRRTGPRQPLLLPASVRPFGEAHQHMDMLGHPFAAPSHPHAQVHRHAMEGHTPASLLVDASNNIVHYSPRAWMFLRIPGGALAHDMRLVPEPLRRRMLEGLAVVRKDRLREWVSEPLVADTDHGPRHVQLRVEPVQGLDAHELALVVFEEIANALPSPTQVDREGAAAAFVERVGRGLALTDQRLREIVWHTEKGGAESGPLQETTNTELRALMEELQRSQEQLQVVNEELLTLDLENQRRIDELAQLSNDLHHLLQSTGIATLFLDRNLRIVRFTPPITDLFSIRHTDAGRPLSDFTHKLNVDNLIGDVRRVVDHQATVSREISSEAGRWYLMRMMPNRNADRVDGAVITLVDITERRRAEDDLREAHRRKDEFLAVLAHELRNPLAPIASGIELMKSAGSEPQMLERLVPMMGRQVRQLVRMVDDLLEVSRISGGHLRLQRAPVQLADIVRDAVASVAPLIERAGQNLLVSMPDEPVLLDADAARLTQVVANLLNNATRYTEAGGRINISAERDREMVAISVRDTGLGMSEEVAQHVFELFYRGNDPRQAGDSGLGIGLAIARQLVELHGGTLSCASAGPDRGSEFTVRIPVAAEELRLVPQRERRQQNLTGHRVLVVDDNRDAAETLSMQVKAMGVDAVQTALSGDDALRSGADFQPDVVMLDLGMPGMDGFEVARRMRREPWGKRAILVAVTGWEEDRQRTKDAGFDRHLTKPVDPAVLESVISRPGAT